MKRIAPLLLLAACALGCASQSRDTAVAAVPVNKVCAIMHEHPVEEKDPTTVSWKGQTVGFCCAACIDEWKKLSAAEKDKALATAMAAK